MSKVVLFLLGLLSIQTFGSEFLDEILAFIDKSESPCQNFYRYRCPRNVTKLPVLSGIEHVKQLINEEHVGNEKDALVLEQEEARKTVFNSGDFVRELQKRCQSDVDCYRDEVMFMSCSLPYISTQVRSDEEEIALLQQIINKCADELNNQTSPYADSLYKYRSLIDRLAVVDNLLAESDALEIYRRFLGIVSDIREEVAATFRETNWLYKKLISEDSSETLGDVWEKQLFELPIYTDLDTFDRTQVDDLVISYQQEYYAIRAKHPGGALWQVALRHQKAKEAWVEHWKDEETELERVDYLDGFQALGGGLVQFFATQMLLLREELPPAIIYGDIGSVIAHEFYHSFIVLHNNTSDEYNIGEQCTIRFYEDFCKEQNEVKECWSGQETFNEDGPDLEGLRAAFAALKRKVGDVTKPAYEGAELSHAQLFFVSAFSLFCKATTDFEGPEAHSAAIVRSTVPFRQFAEFAKTFACQPGDAMFIPEEERCSFFGPNSPLLPNAEADIHN